jgi:hypothetical protein
MGILKAIDEPCAVVPVDVEWERDRIEHMLKQVLEGLAVGE